MIGARVSVTGYEKGRVPLSANLLKPYAAALGVDEKEFVARWPRNELERKGIADAGALSVFKAGAYVPPGKSFGVVLRELREARGWSRAQLAEHSSITYESIYRYETSMRLPSPEAARKVGRAMGSPALVAVYDRDARKKRWQS